MSYGMYIAAEGAMAQNQRMQVIANNLANVDTTGFRRELSLIQARHSEAIQRGEDSPGSQSINDVGGGSLVRQTLNTNSQGVLKQTEVPTDLALVGDGFFEVENQGQRLLTRAGNFVLSQLGQLQTPDGFSVLSSGGGTIDIPSGTPWNVSPSGEIIDLQNNKPIGTLSVVRPREPGDLVKRGQNTFTSLADVLPVNPGDVQVRSGFLELSSVQPTTEMMEMIETSRAFEANVRLIQNQDHMTDSLLSRVLTAS